MQKTTSVLEATQNHIPLKYSCLINKNNPIRQPYYDCYNSCNSWMYIFPPIIINFEKSLYLLTMHILDELLSHMPHFVHPSRESNPYLTWLVKWSLTKIHIDFSKEYISTYYCQLRGHICLFVFVNENKNRYPCTNVNWPRARSHHHSAGPLPSHTSYIVRFACPHMCENSCPLGTNVTTPGHLSH